MQSSCSDNNAIFILSFRCYAPHSHGLSAPFPPLLQLHGVNHQLGRGHSRDPWYLWGWLSVRTEQQTEASRELVQWIVVELELGFGVVDILLHGYSNLRPPDCWSISIHGSHWLSIIFCPNYISKSLGDITSSSLFPISCTSLRNLLLFGSVWSFNTGTGILIQVWMSSLSSWLPHLPSRIRMCLLSFVCNLICTASRIMDECMLMYVGRLAFHPVILFIHPLRLLLQWAYHAIDGASLLPLSGPRGWDLPFHPMWWPRSSLIASVTSVIQTQLVDIDSCC